MGRDSIWKLLLRFSGPAIVSMTVASTYNIVDAIFVGGLDNGIEALAALNVALPIMLAFAAISLGTGVGAASLISRKLGVGDYEGANRVACTTITLSILLGALMTLICLPNIEWLLRLLGASDSVMPMAKSYMSILASFAVVNSVALIMGSIIRAEGSPIFPSVVLIISAVLNIALDPVLIYGLGPVPAMGVAGAATATVIARSFGSLLFIIYFVSGKTAYQFRLGYFLPKLRILFEIYRVGTASIIRMSAASLTMILGNRAAVSFGVANLAVLGILFRISTFAFMPCMGLGQGMLPLVGYNYGAGQKERIGEVVTKTGLATIIWGTIGALIAILLPTQVMSIFNANSEFVRQGTWAIRIFALGFFTTGLQMILSVFFQGIGRGIASLVLSSSRQVIFMIPAILILPRLFGITGLWVAFPTAEILAIILTLIWTIFEFRHLGIHLHLRSAAN